jgi:hypothetical protein
MSEPDFKLTDVEVHSATWARIRGHLEERLQKHRKNNDGNLTFDQTTKLRGRIAEIQYLLGIGEPEPPAPMADHDE